MMQEFARRNKLKAAFDSIDDIGQEVNNLIKLNRNYLNKLKMEEKN